MATFLLTWNPKRWPWPELPELVEQVGRGEPVIRRWSCGTSKKITKGDRVFLLRMGQEPRGIFGSGIVVVAPFENIHWDEEKARSGKLARYLRFRFDALLDAENELILWRDRLKSEPGLSKMHWDTRMSGVQIPDYVAIELEKIWAELIV